MIKETFFEQSDPHVPAGVLVGHGLGPAAAVRDLANRLAAQRTSAGPTAPQWGNDRLIETLREDLMRHHPPSLGCERADQPPLLDGEFDDWAGARWVTVSGPLDWAPADGGALPPSRKRWGGPDDGSFRFAVRHDGKTLYLAVEVRDNEFCPPAAAGFESPGDSVEVGVALGKGRQDTLKGDYYWIHADSKVVLALIGNRPVATPVWQGRGSEAAISVRPGRVRYEAAIPLRWGRGTPPNLNQIGLSLQVNDCDGGQPKGAMRWAGGLGAINANAQFARLRLAPLSTDEMAERRNVIDLLSDAAVSWDLMRQVLDSELMVGDAEAAAKEVEGFLRRHPNSYHASRCLAWHDHLLRLTGKAGKPKTADLARQLNVPELEQAEAGLRVFAQVKMAKGRHPQAVGLRFRFSAATGKGARTVRGVYWGEDLGLLNDGLLYLGPLPAGDSAELSFPAELLELANKSVDAVTFINLTGMAWWGDLGLVDAAGRRSVWVPAGARPTGKGRNVVNWSSRPAPDGSPAHVPELPDPQWSEHIFRSPRADGLANANEKLESAGGRLLTDKCLEAAWLIPDKRLALQLLTATNDVAEGARFVRQFPASPLVADVLLWIANRSGDAGLADQLVAEGKIPRQSARNFYARLLPGISVWQIVGPFSNEANVALRRVYEPEQRVDLAAGCRNGEVGRRWQPATAENDGYVSIGRAIVSGGYQAAYAVVWVRSPDNRRAWLFLESPNVVSAWVDSQRVVENAIGAAVAGVGRARRGGTVEPTPVTLKPGWNRLLLKVCNRYGAWGFRARLGNADGSKLIDLEYTIQQPAPTSQPATAPQYRAPEIR